MTKLKLILATGAASLVASPAFAHDGEHTSSAFINVMHWMSSPTHALIGTGLGIAGAVLVYTLIKKSRA